MGPKMIANCYVVPERKAILRTHIEVVGRLIFGCHKSLTILDAAITAVLVAQSAEARQDCCQVGT
jgi:hypothetical protein